MTSELFPSSSQLLARQWSPVHASVVWFWTFFLRNPCTFQSLVRRRVLLEEHNFGLLGDDFISAFSAMLAATVDTCVASVSPHFLS